MSPLKDIRALEVLRLKCIRELPAAHEASTFTSGLVLPKNRLQLQRGPKNLAKGFEHTDNYQRAVLAHHGLVEQLDGGGVVLSHRPLPTARTRRRHLQAGLH